MATLSWYAWLALRRRVSMSAIGSVIVMTFVEPFSPGFPLLRAYGERVSWRRSLARDGGLLPGGLRDAGQLAPVRHFTDADAAQPELPVHGLRTAAPLAAGVRA